MLTTPFLTDLDSRAAIKGSRDPLGIQQVWTKLGRHVVGNLTTVSNSVRDFTTLLLGYYFAGQLADELGPGTELATFLKWEQLAAYSRGAINDDFSFRGTERAKKNLKEGGNVVTLSDDSRGQIMGNQKTYGLWGLYTVPARASGLVEGDPPRLTPPARELVEKFYLPMLRDGGGKNGQVILNTLRLRTARINVAKGEQPLAMAVAGALQPRLRAKEVEFYRVHLLSGGPQDQTGGLQRQLADLLEGTLDQEPFTWSPAMVGNLAKAARSRGSDWHPLAHHIDRIRTAESVLGPISALFAYLLGLDGKNIDAVIKPLRDAWGGGLRTVNQEAFHDLKMELAGPDPHTVENWIGIADSVATGEYGTLIELLIA
jgi:hypothetical protein